MRREYIRLLATKTDISIHAPREGCDYEHGAKEQARQNISIHAPREGCDMATVAVKNDEKISIHAPREGCDPTLTLFTQRYSIFQSTHPVRGATGSRQAQGTGRLISIHAPREGCDMYRERKDHKLDISIHAPREGCDTTKTTAISDQGAFQSTHPVRGATVSGAVSSGNGANFNPRTP